MSESQSSKYLSEEIISEKLRRPLENESTIVGNQKLREAAVLVPMLKIDREWHLLYTHRTETVQDHKGQVSFPGGAREIQDEGINSTALREAFEEIGLNPSDVKLLGSLKEFPTVSDYRITPVVGLIPWPYNLTISPEEVSRVFTIPLFWLADPAHHEERLFTRPNGTQTYATFFKPYDNEIVWGITARITVQLIEVLEVWD
jgi:8-oxo-dGTP pyrophosphatase MutT (NUDIX family)